jgi:uncharacterized protein YcfJ
MKLKTALPATFVAFTLIVGAGCNTTPVQDGMLLGGALGAGAGAIVGHQSGQQGEGALIGAGVGALAGALVGDQVGRGRTRTVAVASRPVAQAPARSGAGHYEIRVVKGVSGERYEERVWVPHY